MGRIRNFFINTFLGGFLVLLPIAIMVFVGNWLFKTVVGLLNPLSEFLANAGISLGDGLLKLIAFAVVVGFCFLIGLLIRTQLGKGVFRAFEKYLLEKVPFYKTVRDTIQQLIGRDKLPFKQIVLADVFGNGVKMTGFVVDERAEGQFTIFVPTAPNPTNGFIFHLHKDQLEFVDISVEDAMRTVIGAGTGSEDLFKRIKKEV